MFDINLNFDQSSRKVEDAGVDSKSLGSRVRIFVIQALAGYPKSKSALRRLIPLYSLSSPRAICTSSPL